MATKQVESIEVERLTGAFQSLEERAAANLRDTLSVHRNETSDPSAEFATRPLDAGQTAVLLNRLGAVSGYRKVTLAEILAHSESDFEEFLGGLLTDVALDQVEYEAVWAMGKVFIFYVRGSASDIE